MPDLAGWRRERLPRLPNPACPGCPGTAWFDLPPDWVCEVLSPATARTDRGQKLPRYAAHGVRHVWLIDPDLRLLESFENRDGRWLLLQTYTQAERVAAAPFDAVPFALGALWTD